MNSCGPYDSVPIKQNNTQMQNNSQDSVFTAVFSAAASAASCSCFFAFSLFLLAFMILMG